MENDKPKEKSNDEAGSWNADNVDFLNAYRELLHGEGLGLEEFRTF
jgi:hypothetical protein